MAGNKRFNYYKNNSTNQEFVIDNMINADDGDELLSVKDSIGVMNNLSEENEKLKQENKKLKQSYGEIRNSISILYRNGQITFDERAFYLRKLSEIEEGDVE